MDKFNDIFSHIFPYGEPKQYAAFVFATFDDDGNGEISFEVHYANANFGKPLVQSPQVQHEK